MTCHGASMIKTGRRSSFWSRRRTHQHWTTFYISQRIYILFCTFDSNILNWRSFLLFFLCCWWWRWVMTWLCSTSTWLFSYANDTWNLLWKFSLIFLLIWRLRFEKSAINLTNCYLMKNKTQNIWWMNLFNSWRFFFLIIIEKLIICSILYTIKFCSKTTAKI